MERLPRILCALGTLAVVVLAPHSASAQGVDIVQIQIDGPGLDAPLIMDLQEKDAETAMVVQKAVAEIILKKRSLKDGDVPADPGPAYDMMVTLETKGADRKIVQNQIDQIVYPFAAGGPYTQTPPGQVRQAIGKSGTTVVVPGWSYFPDGLLAQMRTEGLPKTTPTPEGEPVAAPTPLPAWLPWTVLIASIVIAVVMFVIGTRRS